MKELLTNTNLSYYRILEKIGAGGMGEVFLADDTRLDRKAALKILPADLANDSDRMRRFVLEAKATSALNHPNIITIYEIGEFDSTHFIAAEYIEGETLRERLKKDRFSVNESLEIGIQIASALQAAHSVNIVHRDIKPENIMVRPDGLVKILDFGIAKLSEPPASTGGLGVDTEAATKQQSQTALGMIIGTAAYMSPEQAQGKAVDARSDIFSFGAVLYEMLSGSQPFAGESAMDAIGRILHKEPTPLNQILPEIPSELEQIINKALCKDCEKRYQSAKDLLADLKELKEELSFQSKLKRSSQMGKETESPTQIIKAATDETARTTQETNYANSIAVLPFTNMSADAENEYFCEGLAEELLNALAKIEDLKVAARTSAFSFKNKNVEVSQIGKTLNVKTILEGSVRKSGNRLRITVQLISAADGYHLWSERYDREMRDIFDVQDEITLAVVDALKVKLFGDEKAAILKKGTENAEAYQLYLKGRFYWNKMTEEGSIKGIEFFEQAVRLDPNYADACVGISDCYLFLGLPDAMAGTLSPQDSMPKARAAAERALEINKDGANIYASLAHVKSKEYDWEGAEADYRRSFELNPDYSLSHLFFGIFLSLFERDDEALKEINIALKLDPLSLPINAGVGLIHYVARRYDEAIEQLQKTLEMESAFPLAHRWIGLALIQKGKFSGALASFQKVVELTNHSPMSLTSLAYGYAVVGERAKAKKLLEELLDLSQKRYVSPYSIAAIYAGFNERERTLEWLEKSYQEKNVELLWIKIDPRFDALRGEPRFENILRRMRLRTDKIPQSKMINEASEAQTAILSPAKTDEQKTSVSIAKSDEQTSQANKPKAKRKWWLFGLLGLILLSSVLFAYRYFTPNSKQIESIAVLPFKNENGNADTEYLSDGMTETLIGSLSQIPKLNVKARSSVFRYKGKEIDLPKIAQELNVQAILNGRVTSRGEQLVLSLELVDAQTENVIWSDQYTRKQSDLATLQSEIARDVSNKLRARLSGAEQNQIAKNYTTNAEAYQLYLKGRYYWNKRSEADIKRSLDYFNQAIALDPTYALAHAGLADAYQVLPNLPGVLPEDAYPKARAAAQKALEIDPNLAEPHAALAVVLHEYDWNFGEAEKEFKRSIELNPNYASAHQWYGEYLMNMGRYDEAIAETKLAQQLDPLSLIINMVHGRAYNAAGRYDEAIMQYRKALEIDPDFWGARQYLIYAYYAKGMYEEAIEERRKGRLPNGVSAEQVEKRIAALKEAYRKSGARGFWEKSFEFEQEGARERNTELPPDSLARYQIRMGNKEQALDLLEKAFESGKRNRGLLLLKAEPVWEPLRTEPRFWDLLRRMNLPQ